MQGIDDDRVRADGFNINGAFQAAPAFTRYDMGVSAFWSQATEAEQRDQREWQVTIAERGDIRFGAEAFVSPLAVVYPERLFLGDRSYVSAHSYLWGDVEVGEDCTLNPFTEVRGKIRIGNGVRVGAHTSILGFNHLMATDRPIFEQGLEFDGITIGDDVWIGSHVTIVDGVNVGEHSVIGAGAVVTKDVTPWSIVAGNPARRLRDRRGGTQNDRQRALARLTETAREETPGIISAAWQRGEAKSFIDRDGDVPTVRAWCDAVELASGFRDLAMLPVDRNQIVNELRGRQDAETGLIPAWGESDASPSFDGHDAVNYNILCAGYALQLLGSSFEHSLATVEQLTSADVRRALDAQPWAAEGWRAGAWVDSLGTAMLWNRSVFSGAAELETLFGWLVTRCDPATGLWGRRTSSSGWLEPVNGFYRLTRGTFAQFGVPLPYPERVVDTLLDHAADRDYFASDRGTACNVLDVIHPLWLAAKQTRHRRSEGEDWARSQLDRILRSWRPGRGFSFALEPGNGWQRMPGLLGTEMWLSITWLLADYLGIGDLLDYEPRGIHRPAPAVAQIGYAG
ncbi:acyltransferase [Arthrobacter sp. NA-172]|uniref:acyltransferase n=1 Tax=Arthrobacter sp. NA-172 TaxID=3367524 RepID=UPI003754532D